MKDTNKRLLEILGLAMIGEGLVGLASPKRYAQFWEVGPRPLRRFTAALAEHPNVMRAVCAAEAAAGFLLAESLLSHDTKPQRLEC
jgi:hypothetical protein